MPAAPMSAAEGDTPVSGAVASTTLEQLRSLGKLEDPLGAVALVLAAQIDSRDDTGASMAALARELRATLTEVTRGASAVADPVDELGARRAARKGA